MQAIESKEHYLSAFRRNQTTGAAGVPAWLNDLCESAIASFAAVGFPTTRHEEWKYTSVDPIAALAFGRGNVPVKSLTADELLPLCLSVVSRDRHDLVNRA